jgi:hypothetical protein
MASIESVPVSISHKQVNCISPGYLESMGRAVKMIPSITKSPFAVDCVSFRLTVRFCVEDCVRTEIIEDPLF